MDLRKYRLWILLLLIVTVPLGFSTKFYTGPAQEWVNNSLGGVFYEIFWCLVVAFFFPRTSPAKIASGVFLVTVSLEFLQLWHPPFLEMVRSGFIGRILLGHTFNGMDFPYYAVGSLAGWYLLKVLEKASAFNPHTSGGQ